MFALRGLLGVGIWFFVWVFDCGFVVVRFGVSLLCYRCYTCMLWCFGRPVVLRCSVYDSFMFTDVGLILALSVNLVSWLACVGLGV